MRKSTLIVLLSLFGMLVLASCSSNHLVSGSTPATETSQPRHPVSFQLENPDFWNTDAQTVWTKLQEIPLDKLQTHQASNNATVDGWIQLAVISKQDGSDSAKLAEDLKIWRAQHPNHPGNAIFTGESLTQPSAQTDLPKNVAVLLPLTGPAASSGNAVRNGFMSAYYEESAKNKYQQTISFYDTNKTNNMTALYQEALSKGANVIVGPLIKNDVQQLASTGNFTVPTIALNYTDNAGAPNFYEFGLSPQDEAKQLADKAMESGKTRALIIAPSSDWGRRMVQTVSSRWQENGGSITETFFFNSGTDLGKAIPKLLHVDPKTDPQKSNVSVQRRQDFDVIFLLAPPQSGREIVPLLRFYYVEIDTPIYATSSIYSGKPDPAKDNDLNGVTFADAPLALTGGAPATDSSRLYAVGKDAYLISRDLPRFINLPNFPVYASTGALTLTANHQFYRRLPWTQIHDGHP